MKNKIVVITGAASGQGKAEAILFAKLGCKVVICDINLQPLKEVEYEIKQNGGNVKAYQLNVADKDAIKAFAKNVGNDIGMTDILINNAGVGGSYPVTHENDDEFEANWSRQLAVNLTAQVRLIRAFIKPLTRQVGGRIINIASTEGTGATLFNGAYVAAKHGSVGLTKALSLELAPLGCTVNCVQPGPIRTGMTNPIPERQKNLYSKRLVPMRRYGLPEEIANVVALIATPGTSFLNGAIIPVDGGLLANNALLPMRDWWIKKESKL